jgi:multicomponent Na+:H+ antiporter subunit F
VLYDLSTNAPVLLDAAIVLALIAFLSTVAFARYIERRAQDD